MLAAIQLYRATGKKKFLVWQTRSGKSREQRRGAGNWHNGYTVAQTQRHKPIPRITDERDAGVADQRNLRALLHRDDKFGRSRQLVVFMITDERLSNVVVAEKLLRVPRVFAGNLVDFFQDA